MAFSQGELYELHELHMLPRHEPHEPYELRLHMFSGLSFKPSLDYQQEGIDHLSSADVLKAWAIPVEGSLSAHIICT